jgi:hypothetical protein
VIEVLLVILSLSEPLCILGDLNVTFSGRPYPRHEARKKLDMAFEKLNLKNLTSEIENNVDHIVISKDIIKKQKNDNRNVESC